MLKVKSGVFNIRQLEDSIRATERYTEGLLTKERKHPIQGEEFTSKAFRKMYEIYPTHNIPKALRTNEDEPIKEFFPNFYKWITSPAIQIYFYYDYRNDKAELEYHDKDLEQLIKVIPNFINILKRIHNNRKSESTKQIYQPITTKNLKDIIRESQADESIVVD